MEMTQTKKEQYEALLLEEETVRSPLSEFWRKFKKQKLAFVSFIIILFIFVITFLL